MLPNSLKQLASKLLSEGRRELGLQVGILSHIKDEQYTIVAVESDLKVFSPGDSFNLQDTYCREVYETGQIIALTEIDGVAGLKCHPLYSSMMLEAYISAPILLNGTVWGTISFNSIELRQKPFSPEELTLVLGFAESLAREIQIHRL